VRKTAKEIASKTLEPQTYSSFKDSKKYKDRITAAQKAQMKKTPLVVNERQIKWYAHCCR